MGINNCIGLFNYKNFLLMLFYAILTLSVLCMSMISMLKLYLIEEEIDIFITFFLLMILFVIIIGSVLVYYLVFHFTLFLRGNTQFEFMFNIDIKEETYFNKFKERTRYERFVEIFGANPILWFIPIGKIKIKKFYFL